MARTALHFSLEFGWMNDPNGAFIFNSKHHMFIQYVSDSPYPTKKTWGHLVSNDGILWEMNYIYPILLAPSVFEDKDGMWSGNLFCLFSMVI